MMNPAGARILRLWKVGASPESICERLGIPTNAANLKGVRAALAAELRAVAHELETGEPMARRDQLDLMSALG